MNLENQVFLVTGANRGLGKAFVEVLVELGAKKIYAAARNPEMIEQTDVVVPLALDITQPENIAEQVPDVTVLINNAGVHVGAKFLDESAVDSLRQTCEVNLFGTLAVSQALAPNIIKNGGGAIVNVLSAGSWLSGMNNLAYSVSKAAELSLTNAMRVELNPQNVQVLALHAGFIDTDMMAAFKGPKLSAFDVAKQTLEALAEGKQELLIDEMSQKAKSFASAPIKDFE